MLGITPNMNKLVKMTIDYDDSKLKPLLISYGCQRISSHVLNRGRLTFSGKLFSSTNVIFPSCDLSIKLNSLNYPQKRTKLSVKSKVININMYVSCSIQTFMLLSIWVYNDLAECCFKSSKTWQSLLGTLEKFKVSKLNVSVCQVGNTVLEQTNNPDDGIFPNILGV